MGQGIYIHIEEVASKNRYMPNKKRNVRNWHIRALEYPTGIMLTELPNPRCVAWVPRRYCHQHQDKTETLTIHMVYLSVFTPEIPLIYSEDVLIKFFCCCHNLQILHLDHLSTQGFLVETIAMFWCKGKISNQIWADKVIHGAQFLFDNF
jgi:hypothetical protein